MATKRTTAEPEPVKETSASYVPVELRNKLEGIAIKMLNQLEKYPSDYNEGQLKTVNAVLEIYKCISY